MACPTCDHTMQRLGQVESGDAYWWCPRCGTIAAIAPDAFDGFDTQEAPRLVKRCRDLVRSADWSPTKSDLRRLHRVGIVESCLPPDDRPHPPAPYA